VKELHFVNPLAAHRTQAFVAQRFADAIEPNFLLKIFRINSLHGFLSFSAQK
jgi:hypothetical protein